MDPPLHRSEHGARKNISFALKRLELKFFISSKASPDDFHSLLRYSRAGTASDHVQQHGAS